MTMTIENVEWTGGYAVKRESWSDNRNPVVDGASRVQISCSAVHCSILQCSRDNAQCRARQRNSNRSSRSLVSGNTIVQYECVCSGMVKDGLVWLGQHRNAISDGCCTVVQ